MPIVVDSSQWTGDTDDQAPAGPIVWGEFADRATAEQVAGRLQAEPWFQQAHPRPAAAPAGAPGKDSSEPATETDHQNLRQNFVGTATASTAMLAAGIVIATGGAALPAVAAAAAAGLSTAAVGEVIGNTAEAADTGDDAARMKTAGASLGILAATEAARTEARAFFQREGARRVWVQDQPTA